MQKEKQIDKNKLFLEIILFVVTATTLIILGIVLKQKFIKLLPTLISLVVYVLIARVNKFAFLVGGLNSIIYAIGYYIEGVYASMASALLFSFPFQIASFILWNKNKTKNNEVKVRKLNVKLGIIVVISSIALWIGTYFIYKYLGTKSLILDNTLFVLGLVVTLLQMFRFIESSFLSPISTCINIIMWILLSVDNIANITYVIYMIFALICQIRSLINWIALYRTQKKIGNNIQDNNSINSQSEENETHS